jgi:hypothetical protein
VHLIFLLTIFLDSIIGKCGNWRPVESEAPPLKQSRGRKRKCLPSSEEQVAVDTAIKIINDSRCRNPYSAFGEHIANRLATYDIFTRSQVEFIISKILYEADMQALSTCISPQSFDFDS